MAGRLAVDFGTSNTVVALWDPGRKQAVTVPLAGVAVPRIHDGHEFNSVPSTIHYQGPRVRVGRQVLDENLLASPATFRWMKGYVAGKMRLPRRLGERNVDNFQAAEDFLLQVLLAAGQYSDFANEDLAFTVPVEAFEDYGLWLEQVAQKAGVQSLRLLGEASAAALGYAARVRPGHAFMVFDFGGGTADISVVKVEQGPQQGQPRCQTLGKSGANLGGSVIDQWIVRHVLATSDWSESDARAAGGLLLAEAERCKEALSEKTEDDFTVMNPQDGRVFTRRLRRGDLEELLDEKGLFTDLNRHMDLAEFQARERGFDRDHIDLCLMVGGSSLIPSVQRLVRQRFGRERVRCERPFDAVAAGAAAYVAGMDFDDRIHHEYALRVFDRAKNDYVYRTIVPAGTPYPGPILDTNPERRGQPLVLTIKATNVDQTRLGLEVFEVSRREAVSRSEAAPMQLVFDQNGGARYPACEDAEDIRHRAMGSKTFITANPPAEKGVPRFLTSFSIDGQKRLCVTVKDNLVGKTLMRDQPMVKLM